MKHKTTLLLTRELKGQDFALKFNGKTVEENKVKGEGALRAYVEKRS